MGKIIKLIQLLFLALSFNLLLGDIGFIINSNHIVLCNDCPDISNHWEKSHSHFSEDTLVLDYLKSKTTNSLCKTSFTHTTEVYFESNFITSIWQPPKIS